MSNFPSPFYAKLMYNHTFRESKNPLWRNLSDYESIKSSVVAVNIYFEDIAQTTVAESPAKAPQAFIADLVR
jgi:hypothetical protein